MFVILEKLVLKSILFYGVMFIEVFLVFLVILNIILMIVLIIKFYKKVFGIF